MAINTDEKIKEVKRILGVTSSFNDFELRRFFEHEKMYYKQGDKESKIYEFIKLNPVTTYSKISLNVGCSETYIQKTIKKFISLEMLDKINGEYKIK